VSRNLIRRLAKLEQAKLPVVRRWHRIIGETDEDLDAQAVVLRGSPLWSEGDGIIRRLIVDPPMRAAA
jgi:hypothetical protein